MWTARVSTSPSASYPGETYLLFPCKIGANFREKHLLSLVCRHVGVYLLGMQHNIGVSFNERLSQTPCERSPSSPLTPSTDTGYPTWLAPQLHGYSSPSSENSVLASSTFIFGSRCLRCAESSWRPAYRHLVKSEVEPKSAPFLPQQSKPPGPLMVTYLRFLADQ